MTATILQGDVLSTLRTLPPNHFGCVITSPPYWGLRSYDETALRIDPTLPGETRAWLLAELERRGIHASR